MKLRGFSQIFSVCFIGLIAAGCGAINFNRVKSPYVASTTEQQLKKDGDVMLVMISDIQCRDKKECERLDKSFDTLARFLARYPNVYKILYVGGDLVQTGGGVIEGSFLDEIDDYFQKEARVLPYVDEILKVCGNHDIKKGLENCLRLISPRSLFYKEEIGNIVFVGLSNWHKDAPQNSNLQKYIPEEGLQFLLEEGTKALKENKILFVLTHEKPAGVGRMSDPRIFLQPFFGGKDTGSVYNSDSFKKVLKELAGIAASKNGLAIFGVVSHTHSPHNWPHTTFVWNDILFINTHAIRRTDTIKDMQKINPFRKLLKLFGITIEGNDPLSYIFGKAIMTVVPWNKHSTARVLFLKCGSKKANLLSFNLTKNEWFTFAHQIDLAVPFECK